MSEFGHLCEVVDRIEAFLREVLPVIIGKLSGRANGKRHNEKFMASQLCKHLNFRATDELFHFHSEDPENESAIRTLDYGVYPNAYLQVRGWIPEATDRLYGLEAKRLPTHSTPLEGQEREREYVVGDWSARHSTEKNLKGGIERYKECVHGLSLERAGMIAFIQREDHIHWHKKINGWIGDLLTSPIPKHRAAWASKDHLEARSPPGDGVHEYESNHLRADGTMIRLRHFWLTLTT